MATGPANDPDVVDGNPLPWEDESFFARDIDGQLVRYEGPRIEDFGVFVQVLVDDEPVTVRKAKPATDAQGNIIRDERGRLIPRDTTVYDAVHARYVKNTGDVHPIPVLCHQEYMRPAGVCRLCSVLVGRIDRKTGETRLGRKPVPACWHPVSNEMTVYTTEGGTKGAKELRQTVGTLLSLLVQNHPQNVSANGVDDTTNNELLTLARRFKDDMPDLGHVVPSQRKQALDDSSPLMLVNHDACILCNRCVRACDEIKFNNVIGKHGKGFRSQIAFDLNDAMGESSCVACGECMISCPTDALTLKSTAEFRSDWAKSCEQLGAEPLSGRELQQRHSFFREISLKFLEWNASAAVLWSLADTSEGKKAPAKNKPLCKEGDYGSTAYILLKGRYAIFAGAHKADDTGASEGGFSGVLGKLFGDRFGRADKVAA
ncbi:MAG: 4Fe-4S binding protein, partial [Pirellulales bacterium]